MRTLPWDFGKPNEDYEPSPPNRIWGSRIHPYDEGYDIGDYMDSGEGKSFRPRAYAMQLDAESLQRLPHTWVRICEPDILNRSILWYISKKK